MTAVSPIPATLAGLTVGYLWAKKLAPCLPQAVANTSDTGIPLTTLTQVNVVPNIFSNQFAHMYW
jgi:hypothetical protein